MAGNKKKGCQKSFEKGVGNPLAPDIAGILPGVGNGTKNHT